MSSGKRQRQKEVQKRVEAAQAAQRRADRQRRMVLVGGTIVAALVVIGIVVLLVVHQTSGSDKATDTTVRPTTAADYGKGPCPAGDGTSSRKIKFTSAPKQCIDPSGHYTATFNTTAGTFRATLNAATAPVTVNNFVVLAEYHYYDGTSFQRVIPDYIIQAGDQPGDTPDTGSPGYTIPDELPHSLSDYLPGSLAMANTSAPHSGGSEFFIFVGPSKLPGPTYSLFGQVTSGMDVVKRIAAGGSPSGRPAHPVLINQITIGQASIGSR
jgi:peptidyl-prolyl cis-trans isomerase B (cyclophilin B)